MNHNNQNAIRTKRITAVVKYGVININYMYIRLSAMSISGQSRDSKNSKRIKSERDCKHMLYTPHYLYLADGDKLIYLYIYI